MHACQEGGMLYNYIILFEVLGRRKNVDSYSARNNFRPRKR